MFIEIKSINKSKVLLRTLAVSTLLIIAASIVLPASARAAACSVPSPNYGTDTISVSVPSTTTYTLWIDLLAPSSSNNGVMVQVNGNSCFNAGGSSAIPINSWTWIDYQNGSTSQKMQVALNSGSNSIEVIGSEPSVGISNILLLADPSCVPVGAGTNCTTGQPSSGSTTPPNSTNSTSTTKSSSLTPINNASSLNLNSLTSGSKPAVFTGKSLALSDNYVQLNNPVTITPTYVQGKSIKEVLYYLNNKLIYTANKAPYTYKLNTNRLENGKYLLASKTIYTSNQSLLAKEAVDINHSFLSNLFIFILDNLLAIIVLIIAIALLLWQIFTHKKYILSKYNELFSKKEPALVPVPKVIQDTLQSENKIIEPSVIAPTEEAKDDSQDNLKL